MIGGCEGGGVNDARAIFGHIYMDSRFTIHSSFSRPSRSLYVSCDACNLGGNVLPSPPSSSSSLSPVMPPPITGAGARPHLPELLAHRVLLHSTAGGCLVWPLRGVLPRGGRARGEATD